MPVYMGVCGGGHSPDHGFVSLPPREHALFAADLCRASAFPGERVCVDLETTGLCFGKSGLQAKDLTVANWAAPSQDRPLETRASACRGLASGQHLGAQNVAKSSCGVC